MYKVKQREGGYCLFDQFQRENIAWGQVLRILVSGGAGFIGSHLVDRLVEQCDCEVIVADNLQRGRLKNLSRSIDAIKFCLTDVRDDKEVANAVSSCDLVYHLGAQSNVIDAEQDPEYAFAANCTGTVNVLGAALKAGIRRVVFTSSREVYGDVNSVPVVESTPLNPKNIYGITKRDGESSCVDFQKQGLQVAILRLANVYGPRATHGVIPRFIKNARMKLPLLLYGGGQVLDFVWIDSVVTALIRSGLGPYVAEPLNIGNGRGISIAQLAERVVEITNTESEIVTAPARAIDVKQFVADNTRARAALQFTPSPDPLLELPMLVHSVWREEQSSDELDGPLGYTACQA